MELIQAINLAKKGDNAGYTFLYESTYKKCYYVALKYLKNEQLAMDVLQDSYIKAFENINQLEDTSKFESWLGTIVAKRSLNELRKNSPLLFSETENEDEEDISSSFVDDRIDSRPDLAIDQKETARLIREIMDGLSDEQRICITMFYMQELSVKEIASTLGVSENTVKSRLNYGRTKIKDKVLELEKKGTKLYGMLPFVFFLALSKKEAMACAAPMPGVETIIGTANKAMSKSAVSLSSGTKTGFVIAGHVISTKILVGLVPLALVIGGGLLWRGIVNRDLEDNQAYLYIDFYDVGNTEVIVYGEAEVYSRDTGKIRKRNAMIYSDEPVEDDIYKSGTYLAEYNLGAQPSLYAKVYDGIVYIIPEIDGDSDEAYSFPMLVVNRDNSITRYNYSDTYLNNLNSYGQNSHDDVALRIKETQYDFSSWVDISKFGEFGLSREEAYEYSKEHNDEWVAAIFATEESLAQYIAESEEKATQEAQAFSLEEISEEEPTVEEATGEEVTESNDAEDNEEKSAEPETKTSIAMVSDTKSEVEVGGGYKSDDGKKMSVSIYTEDDPHFIGTVDFDGKIFELQYLGNNIYLFSTDYTQVVDSGYRIVAYSDNSISLFLNGEFIRNYKLVERYYS